MTDIDMQAIVNQLKERGIDAYVEQTGGGVATIFAGESFEVIEGSGEPYRRWPAVAGPGWFDGPGWTLPKADGDDFYVGRDDDGESPYTEAHTVESAVAAIAALVEG